MELQRMLSSAEWLWV